MRSWRWKESIVLGEQGEVKTTGLGRGEKGGRRDQGELAGLYVLFSSLGNGEPLEDFKDCQGPWAGQAFKGSFREVWGQKPMPLQFGGIAQVPLRCNRSVLDSDGGLERIPSFRKR